MGSYKICTSQIATTLFDNALCTCDDAEIAGYLQTTAFSSAGGNSPGGAAVGINNSLHDQRGLHQRGWVALSIAGSSSPTSRSSAIWRRQEAPEAPKAQPLIPGYTPEWGGTERSAGDFTVRSRPRDLQGVAVTHQGNVVAIPLTVRSARTRWAAVSVPPPCDCKNVTFRPRARRRKGKRTTTTQPLGLSPTEWTNVLVDTKATLPCGTYYLSSIQIGWQPRHRGPLDGSRSSLAPNVTVIGNLQFTTLSPTAEIDIFIENDLNLVGLAVFRRQDAARSDTHLRRGRRQR